MRIKTCEKKLEDFHEVDETRKMQNYNITWNANHETPSKIFFQMIKSQGAKKTILRLKADGKDISGIKNVNREMHSFFKNIFLHNFFC